MAAINLGVDFGSTGLRAAYSPSGEPSRFLALTGAQWQWLLCEPTAQGPLPVRFPSVKSKLGVVDAVGPDGYRVAPAEVVTKALDTLRRRILEESSGTIRQTVISVPARYTATQRTALLDAAGAAGLGKVSLVSDSVAAVIGHTGGSHTGTFLVYGMGYSGFELGLVRAVRSRYRVLGYEGASMPGGDTLDERVLDSGLGILREQGTTVRHGEAGWLRLRDTAERVKERLAQGGSVVFPMFVLGPDGDRQLTVNFEQGPFELLTRSLIARTLDRADALFKQAELDRENVEAVLLVGGSTRMAQLPKLVSGLGGTIVPTGPEVIARGAALHANQLTGRPSAAYEEQSGLTTVEPAEPVRDAPALAATLLTAPASAPLDAPAEASGMDRAQQLIKDGRPEDAAQELRKLIAEAQGLLAQIASARSREAISRDRADGAHGANNADDLLAAARSRIDKGQYQEAIQLAHLAWGQEASRPDVFDAMIEIHCKAAMANPTVASFARDEAWLRCALQHDPTSPRVRGLLAERIYLHGKELHQTGQKDEARRALQYALTWNPEHAAAEDLLRRLGARR